MHGSSLLYTMRVCKNGIKPDSNLTLFEFLKGYPWNIHPCFCRWCVIIRSNGAGTVRNIMKRTKNLDTGNMNSSQKGFKTTEYNSQKIVMKV